MKKISFVCLSAILACGFAVIPAFSQDAAGPVDNSGFYVLQTSIDKIYQTSAAYIIEYRKNGVGRNTLVLPKSWFARTATTEGPLKGELVKLTNGKMQPYMAVYYKDGKTDHVKLYVREDNHKTWGAILPSGIDLDNLDSIEEITISR
ncbi:MAG: hypothetical protein LBC27_02885 [Spirochaetaceae bacterium]|nr:hypothetical protein [Spirochaetaceae bacterium]